MTIKCLIVEDDIRSAQIVEKTIKTNYDHIRVVSIASSIHEARIKIQETKPHLLLLDVNLPDGPIFDLLSSIDNINFTIIFTTAYAKYAIEAFKFSAIDYLLKPYSPKELISAIDKAVHRFDQNNYSKQLEALLYNFNKGDKAKHKIILKNAETVHLLDLDQIICIQSDNNYTIFNVVDGRQIMVSKPLKSYDLKLNAHGFFRVHQSHLVNLQHIVSFNKRDETLTLKGTIIVPVAQSKRTQLLAYFESLA